MSVSSETLKTDNPNRYLKNYECESASGLAYFNAVNKTEEYWNYIRFTIYDSDGDPIDSFHWVISINSNSGKRMTEGGLHRNACTKLQGVKYKSDASY